MLLHCMYNKRKVIAILGVQVLNSEVMSVKNKKYKAVITMQKICTNEQKATVKTIIEDVLVLL